MLTTKTKTMHLLRTMFLMITLFAAASAGSDSASSDDGSQCSSVSSTPDIDLGGGLVLDLYKCSTTPGDIPKLIVVIPGGSPPKEQYSMFANAMVERGYAVMVAYRGVSPFPGGPITNIVNVNNMQTVIDYAKNDASGAFDADNIILIGHSLGSVHILYALAEVCDFPFCSPSPVIPPSHVPLGPEVKLAGGFGVNIFGGPGGQPQFQLTNLNPTLQTGIPFLALNGEFETSTTDIYEVTGRSELEASYDNFAPTKSYIIGEDLNHDAITNSWESGPNVNFAPSPLPKSKQIKRVAKTFHKWIKFNLKNKSGDFCLDANYLPATACEYEGN